MGILGKVKRVLEIEPKRRKRRTTKKKAKRSTPKRGKNGRFKKSR